LLFGKANEFAANVAVAGHAGQLSRVDRRRGSQVGLVIAGEVAKPHGVTFTGGAPEYLFSCESQTCGDIATSNSDRMVAASVNDRIAVAMIDPGNGIRAMVIGASQFSVQISGKTIYISTNGALPVHNVPVVFPMLHHAEDSAP
jgi:ethanolamine utilization protein EutA